MAVKPGSTTARRAYDSANRTHGKKGSRAGSVIAKQKFLELRGEGHTIDEACRLIGYSVKSYESWRNRDPEFRMAADRATGRLAAKRVDDKKDLPPFEEFCEEYLGWRLHWHQLQWVDLLEGRDPRDLHPGQTYMPGRATHIICNTPPEHAKTSTITIAYVTWRILRNPNELIILISKAKEMAQDFLSQIKEFLTNPAYAKLQDDFGPEEGFEKACSEWSASRIRFGPKLRTESHKDPTVQAVGLRGQIYGKRATLIIADDIIDTENYTEIDKQFNWITRMANTRIGKAGRILVIGSRVGAVDLYKELRNPERYAAGVTPAWTYFAQPAVLEYAEDPKDWVTLWPASNMPQVGDEDDSLPDGTYAMWDGPALADRRAVVGEITWIQAYQQEDLLDNAIFPRDAVQACVNKSRRPGRLEPNMAQVAKGVPSMHDLYIVGGMDPASSGHTAFVVEGVDLRGGEGFGKRYLLAVHNQANMTPGQVRGIIIPWTKLYGVKEWRVERVLLSNWIMQDTEIVTDLANEGCILAPHQTTGNNKWDPIAGVMGMAGVFLSRQIELPNPVHSEAVRQLVEQLTTFFPETKAKTDILMALWFAEVRVRDLIRSHKGEDDDGHVHTWWDSPVHEETRMTVHLAQDGQVELYDTWWG